MHSKTYTLLALSMLCFIPNAQAYLDPGSGSFIIQMIIAGLAGAAYAIKMYWNKIMRYFRGAPVEVDPDHELDHE